MKLHIFIIIVFMLICSCKKVEQVSERACDGITHEKLLYDITHAIEANTKSPYERHPDKLLKDKEQVEQYMQQNKPKRVEGYCMDEITDTCKRISENALKYASLSCTVSGKDILVNVYVNDTQQK